MTGLSLNVGLFSGINFADLVDQLIKIDGIAMRNLEARTLKLEQERDALSGLMANFLRAGFMIRQLNQPRAFRMVDVMSSNPSLISVTRNGSPAVGSYTFTPLQMASAQQTVAKGVASDSDALGKSGTITLGKGWSLENSINLTDINGGEGFAKGSIRLTDGNGFRATIDLRKAETINDVINAINDNHDVDVIALLDGDRLVLKDVSGGDVTKFNIQEVSGGTTAASLGLIGGNATNSGGVLTGDVIWRLGENMNLSLLNDGNGLVFDKLMFDFVVNCRDGTKIEVDFAKLNLTADVAEKNLPLNNTEITVGDLLRTINNATDASGNGKGKISARISDDGKSIVIEDNTTGGRPTSISQVSGSLEALPILQMLGLTNEPPTSLDKLYVDMFSGLASDTHNAKMYFQDKAGNDATIEITQTEIARIREYWYDNGTNGAGVAYAYMAALFNSKLTAAGVDVEVRGNSTNDGLYAVDKSGGTGSMRVGNAGSELASRLGLANMQEADGVVALAGASPGKIRFTDQNGKSVDIEITKADLDGISTVGQLQTLFQTKLTAANTAAGTGNEVQMTVGINGDKLSFIDTSGGNTSQMMITDHSGSNIASRLGINTTKYNPDEATAVQNSLSGVTAGDIQFTDRNGNTATITIAPAELSAVTSLNGLAILINDKIDAFNLANPGNEVKITAVKNNANNGINFKDTSGSTANPMMIADVTGDFMTTLGFSDSRTSSLTTVLAGATPGEVRFIDQNGKSVDLAFDATELAGISSLTDLATLFNTKLAAFNTDPVNAGNEVRVTVAVNGAGTGLLFNDGTSGGTASPLQVMDVAGSGSNLASLLGLPNTFKTALSGVTPGEIRFIDQAGKSVDLQITAGDIASITSLDDLANLFNDKLDDFNNDPANAGNQVGMTVALNATGTALTFNDTTGSTTHPIQVFDVSGTGNLATKLGLQNPLPATLAALTPGKIELTDKDGNIAEIAIAAADLQGLNTLTEFAAMLNNKIDTFNNDPLNAGNQIGMEVDLNANGTAIVFRDNTGGTGSMGFAAVDGTNIPSYLGISGTVAGTSVESLPLVTPLSTSSTLITSGVSKSAAFDDHMIVSDALANQMAESVAIVSQSMMVASKNQSGTFTTRNLLGGMDTVSTSTINGGSGLSAAKPGAIEVQDRAGNTATLEFSQVELSSMKTLTDSMNLINKKLAAADIGGGNTGVKMRVELNATKTGLQVVDTSGSTSHNLIFRDLTAGIPKPGTGSPAVPAVPAVDAISGGFNGADAVSGGGNGMNGTATLNFGKTSLLNNHSFAFTNNAALAGFNGATKTFTIYLDAAALAGLATEADRDDAVKAAIDAEVAVQFGTNAPEVAVYAGLAAKALVDATTGNETAISGVTGGTMGKEEGTALLTFEGTHLMNGFTFGFTTNATDAGYDAATQKWTVLLDPTTLAGLPTNADRDAAVKAAIDATIAAGWSSLPSAAFGGTTPPTVKLTAGLGAQTIHDATTGGETAIKTTANGAVMGETYAAAIPAVPPDTATHNPNIASSLGLNANAASSKVSGTSLNRQIISHQTLLSDLNGGTGVTMLGAKILVTDSAGKSATISFDPQKHKTVGDVINEINRSGISVMARINDNGDGIVLEEFANGSGAFSVFDADSVSKFAETMKINGRVGNDAKDANNRRQIVASQSHQIEIEAKDSLDDIRKKINDLNAGYTATILVDGSSAPFRLAISSKQTGAAGSFNVDLSALGLTTETMSEAKDAKIAYGDNSTGASLILSSSTNTFRGTINGMDLTITGVSDTPVTITGEQTGMDVKVTLQTFVDNYNAFRDDYFKQTWFQASADGVQTMEGGGYLWNSSAAKAFDRDVANVLFQRITGIPGIYSLADLGITMKSSMTNFDAAGDASNGQQNPETGKLVFDEDKFMAAWKRNPELVEKFFFDEREYTDSKGNVTKVQHGWAQKFVNTMDRLVGDADIQGKAPSRIDALDLQIDRNLQRISFMEQRLEFKRAMYLKQFYAMEQALARMSSDMNAVGNIASMWTQNYSSGR